MNREHWKANGHYVERANGSLVCECLDHTLPPRLAAFPELIATAEELLAAYREDHAALVEACTINGVLGSAEPSDLAYIGKMAERIDRAQAVIAAARAGA